jgi:protein associated with RNAse G/E
MIGQLMVRRQFHRGEMLGRAWVGHLAREDQRGIWLWVADGSALREVQWSSDMLVLHPRAGSYSVWFFFWPDGTFRDWYVNLEEPAVRWDDGHLAGLDTVDQDLDIVVAPDRSWRWKDEVEFLEHLAHPEVYWVPDPDAVRAEGERLVKLIEAGEFPFDGTGVDFRPDAGWTVPTDMPVGWDRPRANAEEEAR